MMTAYPRILSALASALLLISARPIQSQDAEFVQKVRGLIVQLKDRNLALRKQAEEELFQLGPRALPLLREEESRVGDGDLKTRLGGVIKKIERHQRLAIARGTTILVTLSAKDRPVVDLLDDLHGMTGVPIEHRGIPTEAVASLEVSALSVWEAIDQICRTHGRLAWNVSEKGIAIRRESYTRPIMANVSGYALFLPVFLRNPPGPGTGDREYLRSEAYVAGPPGAVSIAEYLTYEALADDKGTNLLNVTSGLVFKTTLGGYQILSQPDAARPLFESVADIRDPVPGRGASKMKVCKGVAVVRSVVEMSRIVEIRGPALKKGAKDASSGVALEIERIDTTGGRVRMEIAITDMRVGGRKERRLFYHETGGKVVLRDAGGRELDAALEPTTGTSTLSGPAGPPTQETTRFKVAAALKPESPLAGIEIWEPSEIEEIKIPFDFKDVPIRKAK